MEKTLKKALIIVDVQNDFVEGGALPVQGGNRVAERISEFITHPQMKDLYDMVVFTRDYHIEPGEHYSETPDYVNSWPVHCKAGTEGCLLHPVLSEALRYTQVPTTEVLKGMFNSAYSGFEGHVAGEPDNTLDVFLQENNVDAVDVAGLASDYCVAQTAFDANRLGYRTRVITGLSAGIHDNATEDDSPLKGEFERVGIATL